MRRRTFLSGIAVTGAAASLAGPALAKTAPRWKRIRSANFEYYTRGDTRTPVKDIIALEKLNALLRLRFNRPPSTGRARLPIYETKTREEFRLTYPKAPDEVAGFYAARVEQTMAVTLTEDVASQRSARRYSRAFDARLILFHEYVHHFMLAMVHTPYPSWYVEGFAEYFSTADIRDDSVIIGEMSENRALTLVYGDWMSLEDVLSKEPLALSGDVVGQYYAQAWFMTHYISNTPARNEGLKRYLQAFQRGEDPVASFEPSFGVPLAQFDKELRAYTRKKLTVLSYPNSALGEIGQPEIE